ncbi:MAG: hypothetical protein KAY73_03395 [Giesbergeria sp.]|nr:hypothetical protein [Giesbergeria sp.]MBP6321813.1 hypothetical protein [Giesbergeria sp.]MBP8028968.1 hypothetical protein [Giesbergeria sp.]
MTDRPDNSTATSPPQRPPAWWRWAATALALVVLLLVFALYGNPDFMVMLANQMWACF